MTAEHIIFIPIILLIGFITGAMSTPYIATLRQKLQSARIPKQSLHVPQTPKVSLKLVLATLGAFIIVFIGSHLILLPYGVLAVKGANGGLALFDQAPSFTAMEVYQRLLDFGQQGRHVYQRFVFTTDIIFPLTFLSLLASLAFFVKERSTLVKGLGRVLVLLPFIWFSTDMFENLMIFTLISQFPNPTNVIGGIIGFVTMLKFILLLSSLIVPFVVFGLFRTKQ
ncbi:MAG: hypothetical protein HRU38_12315 [Saccharospirillaceae bacterium]|nr:hypothetical protein [Pseudomonadales bacterium]NRB79432.1 hypothetical protein [Saccharospirillaceae bacterium]